MARVVSEYDRVCDILRRANNSQQAVGLYNRRQILTDCRTFVAVRKQNAWPVSLPAAQDFSRLEEFVEGLLDPAGYVTNLPSVRMDHQINYVEQMVHLEHPEINWYQSERLGTAQLRDGGFVVGLHAWQAVHELGYRSEIRWCISKVPVGGRFNALGLDQRGSVVGWLRGF